jgi:hypothetical protein
VKTVAPDTRRTHAWSVQAAIITWLLLVPLTGHAVEPGDIQDLVRLLAKVQQVEVNYREILESGLIDTVISTNGKLFYEAPDHIRKLSEQGRGFQIDGNRMQLINDGQVVQELKVADITQLKALVSILRAIFAGDLETLKLNYHLDYRPAATWWTLDLTPHDLTLSGFFQRIEIIGSGAMVNSIALYEADGDSRTLVMQLLSRKPAILD